MMQNNVLQYGIDVLLQQQLYKQHRIALVTNDAARTAEGIVNRVALLQQGFQLQKLFSPEHGIHISGEDGAAQPHGTDLKTGLPVISLYGAQLAPTADNLADVDLVLFDIPDIGCRYYTYLWTMTHVMEACAAAEKPLVVTDRPNPIGAILEKAEGPFLDEEHCASFLGRWNIPLKHSCTIAELARYFAATRLPALQLHCVPMQGYQRYFMAGRDYTFHPTSPAIQHPASALFYPGTGLFEGVNMHEGRETAMPFAQFGAPWLDAEKLKQQLDALQLPGLQSSLVHYKATTAPYAGQTCYGLQLHCSNPGQLMAVQTGISILQLLAQLHPQQLQERLYPTAANPGGRHHLDRLTGVANAFEKIMQGHAFHLHIADTWKKMMQPYLLYG